MSKCNYDIIASLHQCNNALLHYDIIAIGQYCIMVLLHYCPDFCVSSNALGSYV